MVKVEFLGPINKESIDLDIKKSQDNGLEVHKDLIS